jgi:C-terminal processing protease CtpA/Prc
MRYVCKQIVPVALAFAAIPMSFSISTPTAFAQGQAKASPAPNDSVHARQHSAELGVLVSSSPGKGVHVVGVMPGSPAAKAGIRPGDYVMDINDEDVSTPKELKDKIGALDEFDTIDVTLWRDGKDVDLKIGLAAKSKQLPESHRAWLGVMVSPTDEGMKVDFVHPQSPAEKAGLRVDDVIATVDGSDVKAMDAFVKAVQGLEPGKELKLTVRRDGAEIPLTATLGEIDDAPVAWFRQSESLPEVSSHVIEAMLNEMRREIQALKREVQELKAKSADKEVSYRSARSSDGMTLVVPRGRRGGYGYYGGGNRGIDIGLHQPAPTGHTHV